MLIEKNAITQYIPQRSPFIMVDELLTATSEGFESVFRVSEENPLLIDKRLSESALVENIAQTCAAGFGYLNHAEGGEPKLGFIGAVSRLENYASAVVSDLLTTKVQVISTFEAINLVEGVVSRDGEELLRCQMKIVVG